MGTGDVQRTHVDEDLILDVLDGHILQLRIDSSHSLDLDRREGVAREEAREGDLGASLGSLLQILLSLSLRCNSRRRRGLRSGR